MTRRNKYEVNYDRIRDLIGRPLGDLKTDTAYRLRAPGFMDLIVEVLPRCPETRAMVLSLAHYFEQEGDLCQDPEMTVRVFAPREGRPGMVEALSFQQSMPPIYQQLCRALHNSCYVQRLVMWRWSTPAAIPPRYRQGSGKPAEGQKPRAILPSKAGHSWRASKPMQQP